MKVHPHGKLKLSKIMVDKWPYTSKNKIKKYNYESDEIDLRDIGSKLRDSFLFIIQDNKSELRDDYFEITR